MGSRGDAEPFGALAARLVAEGHEAVLVTHASLTGVAPRGADVIPVSSDPGALLAGPAAEALKRANPVALNRARHEFADFLHAAARPAAEALSGADILVASTFAVAAVDEALQRRIPVVRAHMWPEYPSLDAPIPLLPYSWAVPHVARRTVRRFARVMEPFLAGVEGEWHRARLHLHARHAVGLTTNTAGTLHAYSPLLAPTDAPTADVHVTGWWTQEEPGSLSEEVGRLLDSDGPWVYVGFGSMHQKHPDHLVELAENVALRLGARALVQTQGARPASGRAVTIGHEPHSLLFPRMAAVVHHGGSGTTASALRAGVPSVVVPHFADQYFWGEQLHRVGAAPRPLPRMRLRERPLIDRVRLALELQDTAAELGRVVMAEDGTGEAVRHLARAVGERV